MLRPRSWLPDRCASVPVERWRGQEQGGLLLRIQRNQRIDPPRADQSTLENVGLDLPRKCLLTNVPRPISCARRIVFASPPSTATAAAVARRRLLLPRSTLLTRAPLFAQRSTTKAHWSWRATSRTPISRPSILLLVSTPRPLTVRLSVGA